MDENTKRRCDVIMQLREESWKRIFERRHYEWRAAYTLWAAFGAFIAIALTNEDIFSDSNRWLTLAVAIIVGAAFCVIHGFWLRGLGKATDRDRQIAIHYEKKLRSLSKSELEKDFEEDLDSEEKQRGLFGDWSRSNQWFVTLVLSIALIWAVLAVGNYW
jgi:hypothetical protein